mgnify:CR=1 FL=1
MEGEELPRISEKPFLTGKEMCWKHCPMKKDQVWYQRKHRKRCRHFGGSCCQWVRENAYIEGYSIGGKTATSQTLPRSANKYISSFIGFAPAEDPQVLGMVVIHNPQGIYYGGTIAAPVLRSIFDNVLPYLGIENSR